jgi:hypothetical protein
MTATTEPARLVAGDTVAWTKDLPSYPASAGWVLRYTLVSATAPITFTAAAAPDGQGHVVNVTAATTAAWAPGSYAWSADVSLGAARHTVATGRLTIAPNLAAITAGGLDTRTPARRALDAMDAALAAVGDKAYLQAYTINGRSQTFRDPSQFMALRSQLQAEVAKEERTSALAAGQRPRNQLLVRFGMTR